MASNGLPRVGCARVFGARSDARQQHQQHAGTVCRQLLHVACTPHPRLTLAGTATITHGAAPRAENGALRALQHNVGVAAGLQVGDLVVSVARDDDVRVACRSVEDELGQQWGVACGANEVQASVRCRAWSNDVWCTPTLTLHRDGKHYHPQCCMVVDISL